MPQSKGIVESNNFTYNENHKQIVDAYVELFETTGAVTINDVAQATNISRQTVSRHLKDLQLQEITDTFKKDMVPVVNALLNKAKKGDVAAIKLCMQTIFGWKEGTVVESNINKKVIQVTFTDEPTHIKNEKSQSAEYMEVNDSK